MKVDKSVELMLEEIIDIRREFHMYPELSEKEYETSKRICKYLDKWNIEYESGIAGTGVVAIIRGKGEGKTIGVRADIDALPIQEDNDLEFKSKNPGVMHACGHDVHTAINLGVAKYFKSIENEFNGNVKLFFQPAEETVGGADRMIKEGVLKNPDVDNVIGLHVSPSFKTGTIEVKRGKVNASTNEFSIKVKGLSGHAAYPEKSIDSILISANIVLALQTIVSRNTSPLDPIVISLGKINGGVKNNVIADEVVISGTLRTLNEETREFVKNRIEEVSKETAKLYGGDAEVDFPIPGAFAPLINDDDVVDTVVDVSKELLGSENVFFKELPSMGGDDFSFFAQEVPSCYYYLGSGNKEKGTDISAHNEKFKVDEDSIEIGMKIQINSILKLLEE